MTINQESGFDYKKYSLEQLDNWLNDALNCEDLTPENIYDTIVNVVDESVEYHKKYLNKSTALSYLLKGRRSVEIDTSLDDVNPSSGVSSATKKDWIDFWEETYYPQEHEKSVYTEEELDAMCDAASQQEEKDKCREYNLREAEYYNQRAKIDAEYKLNKELEEIRAAGGFEWTPDPAVSRNDPNRLKYEKGWVYESPDGGKTVTRRRVGSLEKEVVKADGYSTSEKKTWALPVEESNIDGVKDYYITFPDDLLKAADLKEGDTVEWIDRKDGSYELRKSLSCPPCPPCDTLACADHLTDE